MPNSIPLMVKSGKSSNMVPYPIFPTIRPSQRDLFYHNYDSLPSLPLLLKQQLLNIIRRSHIVNLLNYIPCACSHFSIAAKSLCKTELLFWDNTLFTNSELIITFSVLLFILAAISPFRRALVKMGCLDDST